MSSPLSTIPVEKRRQLAATLGLFAVLCVAMGVVATTGRAQTIIRIFSAVMLIVAALLGLAAWGVVRSIQADLAEQRLDAAVAASGGEALSCDCGHDHDVSETTVTDRNICGHDGAGTECAHDCNSCVLASMRPSPTKSRAERLTAN